MRWSGSGYKQPENEKKERQHRGKFSSHRPGNPDDDLREHLQAVLDVDINLRSYGLKADVVKGEAQLSGVVDTLSEKEYARELARTVPGIRKVSDRISVSTDGPITDRDVEAEVAQELEAAPGVDVHQIGAESSGGVVSLVGRTGDPTAVESAKKAASKARGVAKVVNKVKPDRASVPETFHSQVMTDEEKGPETGKRR